MHPQTKTTNINDLPTKRVDFHKGIFKINFDAGQLPFSKLPIYYNDIIQILYLIP